MNPLDINPGLIIWTLVNFIIFFLILMKFGAKPIAKGLKSREDSITEQISNAAKTNEEAKKLLEESQARLDNSQKEMAEIVAKGRNQAEELIRKAQEEARKARQAEVEDAKKEIENSKNAALKELRSEVAGLVVQATEKLLDENLDKEKNMKLVENYIEKIPKN